MGVGDAGAARAREAEPATGVPCDAAGSAAFEAAHVHAVYDAIAPHFAATRYSAWPRVVSFLASLGAGALVGDVGCGNGKYLAAAAGVGAVALGTDRCSGLVRAAVAGGGEGAVADVRCQPLRGGVFDGVVNVAVVHHLATRGGRVEAWRESVRVLVVGGRALFYVWAMERPHGDPVPRKGGNRGRKMLGRRFDEQDMMVPWHLRGGTADRLGPTERVCMRYYHVYREGELVDELRELDNVKVVDAFFDHQNWCAVVERVS